MGLYLLTKERVKEYFPYCPLCGEENSLDIHRFGRKAASWECKKCKAKWQPVSGAFRWKGAKLVFDSVERKGEELLQKVREFDFWRRMAIEARRKLPSPLPAEKIRCPYCRKVYDETHDKCPHCGASR